MRTSHKLLAFFGIVMLTLLILGETEGWRPTENLYSNVSLAPEDGWVAHSDKANFSDYGRGVVFEYNNTKYSTEIATRVFYIKPEYVSYDYIQSLEENSTAETVCLENTSITGAYSVYHHYAVVLEDKVYIAEKTDNYDNMTGYGTKMEKSGNEVIVTHYPLLLSYLFWHIFIKGIVISVAFILLYCTCHFLREGEY